MRLSQTIAAMLVLVLLVPILMAIGPAPAITEDGTRAVEPGTVIIEDISSTVVWGSSGNPYWIKNNITILKDAHLTIEPGVVLLFSKGVTFYVDGTLTAVGEPFNRITFRPSTYDPAPMDWEGIMLLPESECELNMVDISFASGGINCTENNSPKILNSTIEYSFYFAIACGVGSTPLIMNCDINYSQYAGILSDNGSAPIIIGNRINTCWHGVIAYSGAIIYDNYIELCPVGILVWNSSSHIKGNEISHCHDGIFVFFCDPLVEENRVVSCQGNGTRFIGSNATAINNVLEFNDVGFDIPYDSKRVLEFMSGNTVNGYPAKDLYHVGLKDETIRDLDLDSGASNGFYGLLTNQGSITLYDCENVTIENCTVKSNMNGIYTYNSTIEIYNSHFETSRHGDINLAETSSARTYNGSVDESRVIAGDGCYLVSYGNIKVEVRNYTHAPIEDAIIEIRELTFLLQNSTTNETGLTPDLLVKKTRVSSSGLINYTLNIEAWSDGMTFDDNPRSVRMDNDLLIVFTDLGDIIAPDIISSTIENGQQDIDTNASITISFSEPMNRTSVEGAFSISGNVTGTFSWEENDLIFRPDQPYDYLTSYTVVITKDARDIQGNYLKEDLAFAFTTEPERGILGGSSMIIGLVIVVAVIGIVTFLILKRK